MYRFNCKAFSKYKDILITSAVFISLLGVVVACREKDDRGEQWRKHHAQQRRPKMKKSQELRFHESQKGGNECAETAGVKSVWQAGINVFSGRFNYEGSDYPFELQIIYDKESETVTQIKYRPDYTDTYTVIRGDVYLSNDGRHINIDGKSEKSNIPLKISVTKGRDDAEYTGSMLRGDHEGTCRLLLRLS